MLPQSLTTQARALLAGHDQTNLATSDAAARMIFDKDNQDG